MEIVSLVDKEHMVLALLIVASFLYGFGIYIFLQWQITTVNKTTDKLTTTLDTISETLTNLRIDIAAVIQQGHRHE